MAAWFVPALKAVLPHVGTIIAAAQPHFTKKTADPARQSALVGEQIAELQRAAADNAAHIRELAEQLQTALAALEQAALDADARQRRLQWLAGAALAVALLSCLGMLALWSRL